MSLEVGDKVTIMPPWDDDPVIISMQHYVRVAAVARPGAYMVELDAVVPPGQLYGPVSEQRLAPGWRDRTGRWLAC